MNDNGSGKKLLFKVIMFIVIIGGLYLLGRSQMSQSEMDRKKMSASDVEKIFNRDVIGDIDFMEIQIESNTENGLGYSSPVTVSDKNSIQYLRSELNNSEVINDEDTQMITYEGAPLVTFYLSDETILYGAISKNEEGKTVFYVAKNVDRGDKVNYKVLADDDVEEYVKTLYNQNDVSATSGIPSDGQEANTSDTSVTNDASVHTSTSGTTTKAN